MTRVEVAPGFHLNVERSGSGRPLVLLHGFTGSARSWAPLVEGLGSGFEAYALDIVGHGMSDAPGSLEHYRMEAVAADLATAVRALGVERADWLGYSMGGRTALAVAALQPQAVERLVLIGASPGLRTEAERAARRASDEALADRVLADGVEAFVDYWESIPLFASQSRLPPDTRGAIRLGRLANTAQGLAGSLRGMGTGAQPSLWEELPLLDIPVLLLAGEEDAKYSDLAREMASLLPRAQARIVPAAGHAAHLENPGTCARWIRSFLTNQPPEEPA